MHTNLSKLICRMNKYSNYLLYSPKLSSNQILKKAVRSHAKKPFSGRELAISIFKVSFLDKKVCIFFSPDEGLCEHIDLCYN